MLHSKQWHYSLHRDSKNCYSTRRSPTGFFNSNSTRVPVHTHTCAHYTTSREFSIQNPILHAEDKELFEYYYYYIQRAKRPSFQKRNSMHRRQGDLLEIDPCVLQDHPKTFQAFQPQDLPKAFQTFQSFMTFQPLQAILQVPVSPGNPPHSSILQLECIFYSSIGFHRNSTEYQLNKYKHFYKHYILQRKGDVAISVKHVSVKMSR